MRVVSTIQSGVQRVTASLGGPGPAVVSAGVHAVLIVALAALVSQNPRAHPHQPDALAVEVQIDSVRQSARSIQASSLPINPIIDQHAVREAAEAVDEARMLEREANHQAHLEESERLREAERQRQQQEVDEQRQAAREATQQQSPGDTPPPVNLPEPTIDDPFADPSSDPFADAFDELPELERPAAAPAQPEPDPKPDPHAEARAAAAAEARRRAAEQALTDYRMSVVRAIDDAKKYPLLALRRGWSGSIVIRIVVRGDGTLAQEPVIEQGCPHAVLNQEAIDCAKRAAPFPRIPGSLDTLTIRLRIAFRGQ